jgi:hypothetical protein
MVRNERIKRILIQGGKGDCNSGVLVGIEKINSDDMAGILGVPFPLPAGLQSDLGGDDVHAAEIPRSD